MTDFSEKFKEKNAYFLHLQYPDRLASDNWLHSCEILNRFRLAMSYLVCYDFKIEAHSSREWYQNLAVIVDDSNLRVYVNTNDLDIQVASFPLPLELPSLHQLKKEHTVKVDSFISKKLVIEN
jgi:hypothetical protein